MVERFKGRISEVLNTTRCNRAKSLSTTLARYALLYNQQLPQKALNHRTPIEAMQEWQRSHPELFVKRIRKLTEPDMLPVPPHRLGKTERRRAMQQACQLGVPANYASSHQLRPVREPARLCYIGNDIQQRSAWLAPRAATAFAAMCRAAADDDISLQVVSAFRSVGYQLGILQRKLEQNQEISAILKVSAAPGYSEHHSGRAVDLSTGGFPPLAEVFENSPAFAWLLSHAKYFHFQLSYPRNNHHGMVYEPWHWCWQRNKYRHLRLSPD